MDSTAYDRSYYQHYKGEPYERSPRWLTFFADIATPIARDLAPKTALDAGCAMGMIVEALRDRGVDAYGFDISEYALDSARADIRPYLWQASATDPLDRNYDVIICIEVLEHLSADDAARAVENICAHTDDVIFSSSPDDYQEPTHLNVRGPEYWADLFARHGMFRDLDYEPDYIAPWAVRFRRTGDPVPRLVRDYERMVDRLTRENRGLRQSLVERHEATINAEARVTRILAERQVEDQQAQTHQRQAEAELEAMRATVAWRLAERGRRLVRRLRR